MMELGPQLDRLHRSAQLARAAACALRWTAACAAGFAGLLVCALALASVAHDAPAPASDLSASAYLDFDLAVLRAAAGRSFAAAGDTPLVLWSERPDWQVPRAAPAAYRLVAPGEAWAAATSGRSRFRTAARGVLGAVPFLLAGIVLVASAAACGGMLRLAHRRKRAAQGAVVALAGLPLLVLLDPHVFYDRTRSLGAGFAAVLFVAAFAGAMSAAVVRALAGAAPQPLHLERLAGRAPFGTAARLAALDATEWLVPVVPALATAALFVCAKAEADLPVSGLGSLVRAALSEPDSGDRVTSCVLVGAALVLVWYLGHRFVLELRSGLQVSAEAPGRSHPG